MNSRAKGARGERAARDILREFWYAPECERAGQTSGGVCADLVRALPRSHPEVKFLAKHGCHRHYEQAEGDARGDELPFLLLRETKTDNKTWLVAFDATRAEDFVARFLRQMFLTMGPDYTDKFVSDSVHGPLED